jgi:hypothetical protein
MAKSKKKKDKYQILKHYLQLGLAITISTSFFLLSIMDFKILLAADMISGILSICLFLVTLVWFASFINTSITDLEVISSNINIENIPGFKINHFILVIGISLSFGFLISFSTRLIYYMIAASIFETFDILSDCSVMYRLYSTIKNNHDINSRNARAIYDFWFARPTIQRDLILLICFNISLILSLISKYSNNLIYLYIGYLIVIFVVPIAEFIIHRWRIARDKILDT